MDLTERLWTEFDSEAKGEIDLQELSVGLSILSAASMTEKVRFSHR